MSKNIERTIYSTEGWKWKFLGNLSEKYRIFLEIEIVETLNLCIYRFEPILFRVKILRIPSFEKLDRVAQERSLELSANNSLIYVLRDALSLDSGE